jgi:hypothetical protein
MARAPVTLVNFSIVIAAVAMTAPMAHVLEMPNKFALDGALWLAIQQNLYRGWGLVFGPVEVVALAVSLWLALSRRRSPAAFSATLVAAVAYAAMIAVFFVFNDPVNRALSAWNFATMPPDWQGYRFRWEAGHTLSALLSIVGLLALLRAQARERAEPAAEHPALTRDMAGSTARSAAHR